ncbi:MAG: hypothetical protein R6U32_05100 [Candidatus Woesearchaeota archaeon]
MLAEKRIKEAESNIRSYLAEGLLNKERFNPTIFEILFRNSESLKVANMLYAQNHSDLWTIVISYYSMYYMANAVLYKMGYKVGDKISHKITADALIVFVRGKLKESLLEDYNEMQQEALSDIKADTIVKSFDYERSKRGSIQYGTNEEAKHSKAKTSIERAKQFSAEMEKLL